VDIQQTIEDNLSNGTEANKSISQEVCGEVGIILNGAGAVSKTSPKLFFSFHQQSFWCEFAALGNPNSV